MLWGINYTYFSETKKKTKMKIFTEKKKVGNITQD